MTQTLKTFDQADQDDVAISQLADHDRVAFWTQFYADLGTDGIIRLGSALDQLRKDRARRESRGITDSDISQNVVTSMALDVWRHWNWQETLATWE